MTAVAIDGPAGAGKSTVARAAAEGLGFTYVDTGAMYRAVSAAALERNIDPNDSAALGRLARKLEIEARSDRVVLEGADVTERIRESDVTEVVPVIAAHPEVRRALVERQRLEASKADVVMEGRDVGSAVLPDADVKIFLDASLSERARRRVRQLGLTEDAGTVEHHERSIEARDAQDSRRSISPLVLAEGAIVVDSTGKTVEQVVDEVVNVVRSVLARRPEGKTS